MLNVYLLRHGETFWNADGNRYCGHTDLALTEKGIQQAQSVHKQVKDISFEAVYSSPLQRAVNTAGIASGRDDIITDEHLIEADFGNWEGKTKEQFIKENRGLWDNWLNDPLNSPAGGTGESASDIIGRVDKFFNSVHKKHPSGNIMVVAHNGVNRLYLAHKLGMDPKHYRKLVQDNSSITIFTLDDENELTLVRLNSKL
jgi:broad specificity phosphatase PhoE